MLSSKTKKYQVPVNTYVKIGLENVIRDWWWVFIIPVVLIVAGFLIGGGWVWGLGITAVVLTILYFVFWGAQFYGLSQVPQGKVLFDKLSYEFEQKQIKILKTQKEGMMMPWENIKKVFKTKDAFILKLSLVQYIHIPFHIFQTENDLKFAEKLFERKGLL
ncbi:MAG TPA: YcxB family protein [Catalimonadaceae bacterium]|nr:YcxB family protein [Catalimonadaceae bacterium]HPI11407.1 YcxB family protein [Catalimonadaceae bacterium]